MLLGVNLTTVSAPLAKEHGTATSAIAAISPAIVVNTLFCIFNPPLFASTPGVEFIHFELFRVATRKGSPRHRGEYMNFYPKIHTLPYCS